MGATGYSSWYRAVCQNGTTVEIDTSRIEAIHFETHSVEMFSGRCWHLSEPDFTRLHTILTGRKPKTMESEGA